MRINRREKLVLWLGGVVLAAVVFYFLGVEPLAARHEKIKRSTAGLEQELEQMKILAAQYKAASRRRDQLKKRVESRGPGFTPFSALENMAGESGLTGRIESMTPVGSIAEEGKPAMDAFDIRLSGIGLPQLVGFLYRIEKSDKVFIVINLNVRPRYLKPELLDVSLRLATPAAG